MIDQLGHVPPDVLFGRWILEPLQCQEWQGWESEPHVPKPTFGLVSEYFCFQELNKCLLCLHSENLHIFIQAAKTSAKRSVLHIHNIWTALSNFFLVSIMIKSSWANLSDAILTLPWGFLDSD